MTTGRSLDRHDRVWRVAAALAGVAVVGACGQSKPLELPIQTVRADAVAEIAPDQSQRYSVTIQPLREINLAFKSAGIVDRVLQVRGADGRLRDVQAGDRVGEGVELGHVRSADYDQRLSQAQSAVRQAQAQVAQLEAVLAQAEADASRAARLFESASLTKPEYDQAQTRRDSAKAEVEAARAALASARAGQDEAALAVADTAIRAPFAGWIAARNVETGGLVGSTTAAFSVIDTHAVKAAFAVPDTSLGAIKTGQQVFVWLDALSDRVSGVVTSVSPAADPRTHVYSVDVTIDNVSERIRPGMVGSVTLDESGPTPRRLVVPLSAVVRDPANAAGVAVFRIEERGGTSVAVVQPVVTGETFGNSIEVTSGVHAGDLVVSLGGELLRSGDQVRVIR